MTTMNQGEATQEVANLNDGNPSAPSAEGSNSQTVPSTQTNPDVKKEGEKKVPYDRFSEVVKQRSAAEAKAERLQAELDSIKAKTSSGQKLTENQQDVLVEDIPDEIKVLFGEEMAPEGKKALDSYLKKVLGLELTDFQKRQVEAQLKQEQELKDSDTFVENETKRVMDANKGITDKNKFHKFIMDRAQAGKTYRLPGSNNLDFDLYAELYLASTPKPANNTNPGLDKVSGVAPGKTTSERIWSRKDFR